MYNCDWLFCALKNVKVKAGRLWEMSGAQGLQSTKIFAVSMCIFEI